MSGARAARRRKLGLKLESARGPVGILVIDRAEKPALDERASGASQGQTLIKRWQNRLAVSLPAIRYN
jgi:hypothetical protein